MLSNLASYLGYPSAPSEVGPDVSLAPDMRMCAVEEDEWVLVDKQEPTEALTTSPSALPGARPSTLQESWYLTPPPSFTSRGPIHMETSPFENLLIEHPSMSVYQKSGRRKMSNSSPSASEEESPLRPSSEDTTPVRPARKERLTKIPRNKVNTKYSKKLSNKRPPTSSSDDALSLPSASEDDERKEIKEVKMKNFVKSPRRSISAELQNLSKKCPSRGQDSSSDDMISILTGNDDDAPTISALVIHSFAPPKKLYSDVLRTSKPKVEEIKASVPLTNSSASPVETAEGPSLASVAETDAPQDVESSMVVENSLVEKDRRRTAQNFPDQHRQHFLNRSAQKLEQRKTCELVKRNTMGRNNKAREINSRNKRQRRSDMMQRHSGVNNNRKCC